MHIRRFWCPIRPVSDLKTGRRHELEGFKIRRLQSSTHFALSAASPSSTCRRQHAESYVQHAIIIWMQFCALSECGARALPDTAPRQELQSSPLGASARIWGLTWRAIASASLLPLLNPCERWSKASVAFERALCGAPFVSFRSFFVSF